MLDLLVHPSEAVAKELKGLARENQINIERDGIEAVKFMKSASVESLGRLMDQTRNSPIRYYQQTAAAYYEGLARAHLESGMRVVEIGAERTLWKLNAIRELCIEAYAVNIFFHDYPGGRQIEWPVRVLADMNELPLEDDYFDLVIASATLHHSDDIEKSLREIARILKPGGRALMINEPVAGIAKSLGGPQNHLRDAAIREDPVSLRTWLRAIRQSGLDADHFVPCWFTAEIRKAQTMPAGTRFLGLARALSPLVKRPMVGDLIRILTRRPAQALLGIPLNVVLWKRGPEELPSVSRA